MAETTVTQKAFQCERCDHVWVPRATTPPRACPKCKSPYWDVPRLPRFQPPRPS